MLRVIYQIKYKYGIINGNEPLEANGIFEVKNLVEKPHRDSAPSNLAIIGRYILTPEIFDILDETLPGVGGEIQLTDALQVLANRGDLIAVKFEGNRFDCGDINGYVKAINYLAKKQGLI